MTLSKVLSLKMVALRKVLSIDRIILSKVLSANATELVLFI